MRVDRTSVFQEGRHNPPQPPSTQLISNSTIVQFLPNTTSEMSSTPYQDCPPTLHWRTIPHERSHNPFLWHLEALPEQRCLPAPDGPPHYQGACSLGGGYYYGHKYNHEGYWWWYRRNIQTKCYPGTVSDYWCKIVGAFWEFWADCNRALRCKVLSVWWRRQ